MFKVKHKENGQIYVVYELLHSCGETYFLVYIDGMWKEVPANEFEPYYPECKGATKKRQLNESYPENYDFDAVM